MRRYHVWTFRAVIGGSVLAAALLVGYFGIGRWWRKASARDVQTAILRRLSSSLAYRQFAQDLKRREAVSPIIDIWLPVQESQSELDDRSVTGDDLKSAVGRIARARGTIRDGNYRLSIVARTEHNNLPFHQSVKLADDIGEVSFSIHNGRLQTYSLALRDLPQLSHLHERFITILAALRGPVLPPQYRSASLQLLDGRACNSRTARHIERLYSGGARWPDIVTERLVHLGFMTSIDEPALYYSSDHFALVSSHLLGVAQALTLGERSCRVCVLATIRNAFGEAVDGEQTILALEQNDAGETTVREVLRIDATEFNADIVNGLVTGRISNPLLWNIVLVVGIIILAVVVRYVLAVCIQIKTLTTKPVMAVVPSSPTGNSAGAKQDETDAE